MSLFDTVAKARALREGHAIELQTAGRYRLVDDPAILTMYALPGEDATIFAVMFGYASDAQPRFSRVIMDPRNRTEQYDLFIDLGRVLGAYFAEAQHSGSYPQIVISGPSSVAHVLALAGRALSLRTRDDSGKTDDATLARNRVIFTEFGERLGYLRNRWETPGQQILVPATDMLTAIWATGQSALEDAQLHAVRAWIDPQGQSLENALSAAEQYASGSKPRPAFDKLVLMKCRRQYQRAAEAGDRRTQQQALADMTQAVLRELAPTYEAIRWAIERVQSRTVAPSGALRKLAAIEAKEFQFFIERTEEEHHLFAFDPQTVRTKTFLAREAMLDIVDGLFAKHDAVERARLEADGKVVRARVESLAPLVVSAYLPNGGPRRGDTLADLGEGHYDVEHTAIDADGRVRITLAKHEGCATPPVGDDLLLISECQDPSFLITVRSVSKKRLSQPSWLYDTTIAPPARRREKPRTDLLALVEEGEGVLR